MRLIAAAIQLVHYVLEFRKFFQRRPGVLALPLAVVITTIVAATSHSFSFVIALALTVSAPMWGLSWLGGRSQDHVSPAWYQLGMQQGLTEYLEQPRIGVSTLAKRLAKRYDLVHLELDAYVHGPAWTTSPGPCDQAARSEAVWCVKCGPLRSRSTLRSSCADTPVRLFRAVQWVDARFGDNGSVVDRA